MTEQEYEPLPLDVPKGWYPMPDGRHRYWDGKRWSEKFTSSPPTPAQTKRRQRNLGWRLDYIFATKSLAKKSSNCQVMRDVGTSDHAPVVVEL